MLVVGRREGERVYIRDKGATVNAELLAACKEARTYVACGVANKTQTTAEGRKKAGEVLTRLLAAIAAAEAPAKPREIIVAVASIRDGRVKVGIEAPAEFDIVRHEIDPKRNNLGPEAAKS